MHVLISLMTACLVLATAFSAAAQTAVERGRYLVEVLGACGNCHTPKGPQGDVPGKHLAGGFQLEDAFGTWITPNITPDPETGLGGWKDGEIIASLYGVRRGGGRVLPPMPTQHYAQGIAEADLRAILAYLRALPPIRNQVPVPEPPKKP